MAAVGVLDLVRPEWPPMRHVRRGWDALDGDEQAEVAARVEAVLAKLRYGPHKRDALLRLFAFLAQVETIAIEIPLRFLPHAPETVRPLLRRQLVDEVFHSTLFARLAHDLALPHATPPPPLPSAERLLEQIRKEPDLAVTATLLNLVAEGWIETLFRHCLRWGAANAVFRAVLADEARHVDEAPRYMAALDAKKAQAAVERFEAGMAQVSREPAVALAILDIAGADGQAALAKALQAQHRKHLRNAGLRPSAAWDEMARLTEAAATAPRPPAPTPVPDTHWRRLARRVWLPPRDPTMQGDFDIPVGHIPKKLLTPVLIAALGRAWAKNPELNRVIARDQVWQLPSANVGVRVLLDDDELATVVIPEADKRSVRDIQRMLADGIEQLRRNRIESREALEVEPELAALAPPMPTMFAVALSNAGKWGVVSGAGSFSGWVSPSTDITMGYRRRLPRWMGVAYLPSWHVNLAAIQDHRVFDGRASAIGTTAIQEAMSPRSVRLILATEDTLPPSGPDDAAHDAQAQAAAAPMLAFLSLPKYTPIAIGGLGLGALAGVTGYLLYQNMAQPAWSAVAPKAASMVSFDGPVPTETFVPDEGASPNDAQPAKEPRRETARGRPKNPGGKAR